MAKAVTGAVAVALVAMATRVRRMRQRAGMRETAERGPAAGRKRRGMARGGDEGDGGSGSG
jgi:hypothetical protein